jgi:hypothetical protein
MAFRIPLSQRNVMKKLALISILAAAVALPGCFKVSSDSVVNNDGSATMKLSMAVKSDVIAKMKEQIDQAIEMLGDDHPELAKAKDGIDKLEGSFDEKKAAAEWKKMGLEVSKSTGTDKDGWKGFEIEGSTKNVGEYVKKHADARKAATEAAENQGMPDASAFALPRLPKFYKTDQPNVAKVVMVARDRSARESKMGDLENMDDQMKEQVEMGLEQAREQMSLNDMKIEMKIKLPGKILSVNNCKQEGDQTLVLNILGSSMNADSVSKFGQQASATFQIDPKEFKIPLEDEPKGDSRPASRKEAEKPKKNEEEKKNKEGEEKDKDR